MTHDDIDNTPVSMLSIEEVLEHLYRRNDVRAMLVLSEESPGESFVMRRFGGKASAVGLLTAAVEAMEETEAE